MMRENAEEKPRKERLLISQAKCEKGRYDTKEGFSNKSHIFNFIIGVKLVGQDGVKLAFEKQKIMGSN